VQSGSGGKKRKKVTINQRCGSVSGGKGATAVQAGGSAKWKWWQKNKKGGNNQPEVWLHEWWHGGNCCATMWQCRLQSTGGVAA